MVGQLVRLSLSLGLVLVCALCNLFDERVRISLENLGVRVLALLVSEGIDRSNQFFHHTGRAPPDCSAGVVVCDCSAQSEAVSEFHTCLSKMKRISEEDFEEGSFMAEIWHVGVSRVGCVLVGGKPLLFQALSMLQIPPTRSAEAGFPNDEDGRKMAGT